MLEFSKNAITLEKLTQLKNVSGYEKLMVTVENKSYELTSAITFNGVILLVAGNEVKE